MGTCSIILCMRVIRAEMLRDYWQQHADIRGPLEAWYEHVKRVHWGGPIDVKREHGTASILPNNRVVFNIKGNNYRLVVRFNYKIGIAEIRFVGTHAQYDRIDATQI
jgi:mRNA interferase HigB